MRRDLQNQFSVHCLKFSGFTVFKGPLLWGEFKGYWMEGDGGGLQVQSNHMYFLKIQDFLQAW
jgi:hypothetical protein